MHFYTAESQQRPYEYDRVISLYRKVIGKRPIYRYAGGTDSNRRLKIE